MPDAKRLLIVDDSVTSRQNIRAHVRRHRRDWQIFDSDNGADALQMIAAIQPDFVTMDVNMPAMSGLEAAERIRKQWPHIRIALVTANQQEATAQRAAELGIAFVTKHIRDEEPILTAISYFEAINA